MQLLMRIRHDEPLLKNIFEVHLADFRLSRPPEPIRDIAMHFGENGISKAAIIKPQMHHLIPNEMTLLLESDSMKHSLFHLKFILSNYYRVHVGIPQTFFSL